MALEVIAPATNVAYRPAQTESALNMTIGTCLTRADDTTGVSATTARPEISDAVNSLYRSIRGHRSDGCCQTLPSLPNQRTCTRINPPRGFNLGLQELLDIHFSSLTSPAGGEMVFLS